MLGRSASEASAVERAGAQLKVQEALNGLDPLDREVLVLRHFEQLSIEQTARAIGITTAAASERYLNALKRLQMVLSSIPGLGQRR